ncbi:MAG: transcriptional repressor [Candidatus Nanopelagicales bacterium]
MSEPGQEFDARLRAVGLRSTVQRRALLAALHELGHATVDDLAAHVQRHHPDVSLSTIYRTVEALDEAGLVTHAHLHHRSPTYHSVDEAPHVHLVCTRCGHVEAQPAAVAQPMAAALRAATGFVVEVPHLAVHGLCAPCADRPGSTAPPEALSQA